MDRSGDDGGEATTWGLGWIIADMNGEEQIPRLSGSNAGISSGLVLLPEKNFAVAMIANLEFIDPYPLIVASSVISLKSKEDSPRWHRGTESKTLCGRVRERAHVRGTGAWPCPRVFAREKSR